MNIITIENICKSYSEKILLNNVSLGINEGEKIGVLGINGTGKSTLLKIIAGVENYDSGKITKSKNANIEYLPQDPDFDNELTVLEQVFKGTSPVMKLISEYEYTLEKLNKNPEDSNLQNKLMKLNQEIDVMNAWQIESEAKAVLTKLGVCDFNLKIETLSGGQKKRVALASALINPCDLLILDEPTNHMDNETISWLEEYLNNRKGSLLMITHDRYFLNRVVNKIIEVDNGNVYSYPGNYTKFLELKEQRQDMMIASERKRRSIFRTELEWIKRGAKARTTKQKARIDRFEKLKEEKLELTNDKIEISVGNTRLGKKVIEINNISKSFDDKKVIDNFSYIISKGDRVGIIGNNGCGKSTLINIIVGKLQPDYGIIDIGETVKIGYFSQENEHMKEELRVIEYIKEEAEYIYTSDGKHISASSMLERFLFPPHAQWTPISKLSGGEKRRLYLLRVLMSAPNVLILDEPTNDLDIQTLTILEEYLDEFEGCVITVSHDRYFLNRIVDKILSFRGNGHIEHYVGNYSDYEEFKKNQFEDTKSSESKVKKNNKDNNKNVENKKNKPLKFSFKEQKEYEEIDGIIEDLENKLEEINKKINNAGSDFVLLQELMKDKEVLENTLKEKFERWTYLNELAEKIANSK
ncbi:ABC-F family ATP-binding cassette domain-containing protein [Tepidibacter formicigenes]|jgi:ATP-binding cassette subfamily F protein uup|uniref:ATP-binding cassette, subfamily F, uup n=1 Tax=Tepidibacter formicigenes DSM 15518 TaxID=1123349 RepID=A0A1M6L569_9FIRM|nr:ABC-F family ATP-binding cassette domain-containing protein [Tepidibacter formicigenes]SHJ66209.1 ATP-binding cassette, subfamily F, uup [Tepidibacter formicigenes DSM 15518]